MFARGPKVIAGLLLTAGLATAQNRPGLVPGPGLGGGYNSPFQSTVYPGLDGVYAPPYGSAVSPGYGTGFVPGFGGGTVVWPWYVYPTPPDFGPAGIPQPLPQNYAVPALPNQFLSAAVADRQRAETAARLDLRTTLTVELPTAAELWVNGAKLPGGAKLRHAVSVPAGAAGESVTVNLRSDWTAKGKGYTFTDRQTLTAGDSKTLLVYNGTPTGK